MVGQFGVEAIVSIYGVLGQPVWVCVMVCLLATLGQPAANSGGQRPVAPPRFKLPRGPFRPNGILEIYGTHLGPEPACSLPLPSPYPFQACGVQVTVGGIAATLQHVSARQILLWLPEHLGDAAAPIQVCVHDLCSEPAIAQFSSQAIFMQLEEPAYVHMPLWIAVDLPHPHRTGYPCRTDPWDFRGRRMDSLFDVDDYRLEVRHEGTLLAEAPRPKIPMDGWESHSWGCMSGFGFETTPPFRLPLHLAYKIDSPGIYSVRVTGSHGSDIVVQSAWTDIEVKPRPPSAHDEWLRSMAQTAKTARMQDLLRDVVPSLMAWPDDRALRILLPVYSNWLRPRRLVNSDFYVAGFLRNSLAAFDDSVLRRVIPAARLAEMCPPQGRCKVP